MFPNNYPVPKGFFDNTAIIAARALANALANPMPAPFPKIGNA